MISSFMIVSMLITSSCQNGEIVGPVQKENTIFGNEEIMNLEFKNIGEIHNQILTAFDNEHDLLSEDKLSSEEFVSLSMKSINKVLKQHNAPFEVKRNDIIFVLSIFAEIREQGVYDFFYDSEQKLRDVEPLFHYLEENMGLNKESSARCLRIANNIKKDPESKMFTQNEEVNLNNDKYAISFSEVLNYSHDFWVTKNKNLEADFLTQKSDTLGRDSEILADAAGALIGGLFGGIFGAAICGPVASIAITSVYAYPEYWLPPTHIGRW